VNLHLDWCDHKAAKYACENWHYSKKIPVSKLLKIGVWEDNLFIGVVIFGSGASATLHCQFGLQRTEVCELVRVALRGHINPVSKIISVALKLLHKKAPGIKVVVSFADTAENHHGGIYQATNWIYTGETAPVTQYFSNGDWRHATDICKRLTKESYKKLRTRKRPSKHRYVYTFDKEIRKQIEPLAKPYPKRLKKEALSDQDNLGGAVPT